MTRLVLSRGRIIDPASGLDRAGDLVIEAGLIAAITAPGAAGPPALSKAEGADRTLDCRNRLVAPGLIDLHVHLRESPHPNDDTVSPPRERRDTPAGSNPTLPRRAQDETIATGAAAAAAGGFSAVCAMPNTQPPLDSAEAVAWYAAEGRRARQARVWPVGCMTRGRAGREPADLAAMKAAGAVAFSDDGSDVADAAVFDEVLRRAAGLGVPVFCHCEDAVLAAGGVINDGPLATALGLPGIPPESEEVAVERACDAAVRTGCHVHICHVSTEGAVEAIRRAKAAGARVTAEAGPQHLALTEHSLTSRNTVFKVTPPLRSGHDVDAVVRGVVDGTIDGLATDHAPHSAAAKAKSLAEAPFGMIGLESALAVYAKVLVESGLLSWPELLLRLTANPARILGGRGGSLAIGSPADVVVIDPDASWTIDPSQFKSLARNCPFSGWSVRGRAVMTVVDGEVVFP
jgi:dihydroorotase